MLINYFKLFKLHKLSQYDAFNRNFFKNLFNIKLRTNFFRDPPYSHITQIGDPVLRLKSNPIPDDKINSPETKLLVEHLTSIMRKYSLVGISAAQIGLPLQLIIIEFPEKLKKAFAPEVYKAREMETLPLTVVINPKISILDYNKILFQESCGSVCGYSADVSRFKRIEIIGKNENNEKIQLNLNGWNARIAQHEVDHLNGQLFVDIMEPKSFMCTCWHDVNKYAGRLEIPFYPKK